MPSKKNGRSGPQPHKRWVFTLNNPSEDERKKIRELPISLFDYFIVGEEGNEEGRTPHLQGFVNFVKKQTFNKVKWYFGARCHIEKAKGTDQGIEILLVPPPGGTKSSILNLSMSTAQEGVVTVVALTVYPKVRERRLLKMPFFLLQR
nr:truncated ORF1 [Porcine circovirus]